MQPRPMMQPPRRVEMRDFFVYDVTFASLANGTSATQNVTIQADANFHIQKLTYMADIAAAIQTDSSRVLPLVKVLITDTASGRQLMDTAVPIPALFGTGPLPFILPRPRVIASRSTLTVTATNYSAGTTYNFQLSFIGEKVYLP
jgi:hypothetical protein